MLLNGKHLELVEDQLPEVRMSSFSPMYVIIQSWASVWKTESQVFTFYFIPSPPTPKVNEDHNGDGGDDFLLPGER